MCVCLCVALLILQPQTPLLLCLCHFLTLSALSPRPCVAADLVGRPGFWALLSVCVCVCARSCACVCVLGVLAEVAASSITDDPSFPAQWQTATKGSLEAWTCCCPSLLGEHEYVSVCMCVCVWHVLFCLKNELQGCLAHSSIF